MNFPRQPYWRCMPTAEFNMMEEKFDDARSSLSDKQESEINSLIAFRMPPFWKPRPALEMQFRTYRVTKDDAQFAKVVSELDPKVLGQVADIIDSPPLTKRCRTIKNRITTAYGVSEEVELRELRTADP